MLPLSSLYIRPSASSEPFISANFGHIRRRIMTSQIGYIAQHLEKFDNSFFLEQSNMIFMFRQQTVE
jgi:hypothetical protein